MRILINYSFLSLFVTLILSSCLKERVGNIDTGNGNTTNVVEFKNTGNNLAAQASKYPRFNTDLGVVNIGDIKKINLNISYSGVNQAPSDITVNLGIDEEALALFNEQNGTNYVVAPASLYSFPSTVVIKSGTRLTTVTLDINVTEDFDFSVNYAVPLKIVSTSPEHIISGNFGVAIFSFGARNIYDGVYTITALAPLVDAVDPSLTGLYPLEEMSLITTSGNSNGLYDGQYFGNDFYHPIKSGASSISAYGSFSPEFIFDDGKVISVKNVYGQDAGALVRSGQIDSDYDNNVEFNEDGTVKYFDVKYVMTQGGAVRTTFTERFTRTGSR